MQFYGNVEQKYLVAKEDMLYNFPYRKLKNRENWYFEKEAKS